ncbi:glycosyltransferase family 4 protein [Aestuariibaculum sp. YM273]|uniref:glycosyltransferase family 4 protein n=1 Tax=Aestuariibaculum sp. YM273 TaxID=3070659 RepID=UPI0027DBB645|nr:glycosyltransferase family 4 protein [Aestuariibaculum sp. YM273]WMI65826.1 glycosyltransferase family 4 protein [Aestuariibaculum sp. YM273]
MVIRRIIIFFIPYHHIGGAERVHLEIIKALKHKPIVFFDRTDGSVLSDEFRKHAYCFFATNNKRKAYVEKGLKLISYFVPLTLFGCNSLFFYQVIQNIKKNIKTIDLTHAFSYTDEGIEILSLPYVHLLDHRVVINTKTLLDYKALYEKQGMESHFLKRFSIIPNGIPIGMFNQQDVVSRFHCFTIGFVGRNSVEKRPELFFDIVKDLKHQVKVIGNRFENFKKSHPNVSFLENCNAPKTIQNAFSEISVLIVSSSREGFPLVIMEAMALGIPVISTNVGSIHEHLINGINGFISEDNSEKGFLNFTQDKILQLSNNLELYSKLAHNARVYAESHFALDTFKKEYNTLFYA